MINIKILIGFQSLLLSFFWVFFCIFINRSKTDSSFFCFYSFLQLIFINIKGCRVDKTVGIYIKAIKSFQISHEQTCKIFLNNDKNFITNLSTDQIKLLLIEAVKMTNGIAKCTFSRWNRHNRWMPARQK